MHEVPNLMPENAEAYEIYQIVQGQHIMGFNGPVDLNLVPVFELMKIRDVEDKERCLSLIRAVYYNQLKRFYSRRQN